MVFILAWLYTFTYPCQPIEGEGTVIPLINLPPENEKTLGFALLPSSFTLSSGRIYTIYMLAILYYRQLGISSWQKYEMRFVW